MPAHTIKLVAIMLAVGVGGTACTDSTAPNDPSYDLDIPTSWASSVTNTFFPLVKGRTYQYRGQTPDGLETITVEVLQGTRTVNGVAATEVRDRVYLDGELIEDTRDWFAQDTDGNVWYLGESSKDYENGVVVSTEGSWEWGIDGALPGIIMWADPASEVGDEYRQEFYEDHAEDWGKVVAVGQSVTVPYGSFSGCITTEDWNGLEPDEPHENKIYCPQIGLVRETKIGSTEKVELISVSP
jgi:hypothetical protein